MQKKNCADKASPGMKIQPYPIEEGATKALLERHLKWRHLFHPMPLQDGNLITGQQQNSGAAAAELDSPTFAAAGICCTVANEIVSACFG
ncbi:MAG: hypothetical protein U5K54_27785 [Cytophagales bacterium]|nr:hypothetical protein [Cytophagales bacterium]